MADKPFPFLQLPLELRETIYSLYFKPADRLVQNRALELQGLFGGLYRFDFDLYEVNKQIYQESRIVWQRENIFVKIATPWPSAGMYRIYIMATEGQDSPGFRIGGRLVHISTEGLVPIVCTNTRADMFKTHSAIVQITAPFHQAVPEHTVIVLLDDLHLFSQTWYYSALSYPMLNDRLSAAFVLCNPYPGTKISQTLQRRLLLPFVQIKGLYHKDISGYDDVVRLELEEKMNIPLPTLSECLAKSADLMEQGDAIIKKNPSEALIIYIDAFRAIHILVHGRTRRVLGDAFFHEGITSGCFAGQSGMIVRLVLRFKLVARVVLAYLTLEDWGEAAFWGIRSIHLMQEAMAAEFEDYISELIEGEDIGMIYVRTALAFWKMEEECKKATSESQKNKWRRELTSYEGDEMARSEEIWKAAKKYLSRNRADVRKELERFDAPKHAVILFSDDDSAPEGMNVTA